MQKSLHRRSLSELIAGTSLSERERYIYICTYVYIYIYRESPSRRHCPEASSIHGRLCAIWEHALSTKELQTNYAFNSQVLPKRRFRKCSSLASRTHSRTRQIAVFPF